MWAVTRLPVQEARGRSKKLIAVLLHDTSVDKTAESTVLKQIARFGGDLPDRVQDTPKVYEGLDLFLDAFYDLDTERDLSVLQPIPSSQIRAYAQYYDLGRDTTGDLLTYIRRMDNEYLRMLSNKRKRQNG